MTNINPPPPPPPPGGSPQFATATQPTGVALPQGVAWASPWIRLGAFFLETILIVVTLFIGWLI